ncbi:glycosyltransferase [Steroidobacter sp.]|uniref:glycosyltransferase n=1 Tax=Steroidobacter sp. TaxID=1978227 RepID=UPI001A4E1DD8|nr:glycosyltransferase [Steroidobacter sp.]MBL8267857.1 glycosyltransferase [Steroidobacter sp.]
MRTTPSGASVSNPRRIVHVIGAFIAGGAERFVVELCFELKARGFDVAVWALSSRTDEVGLEMQRALSDRGIEIALGPQVKVRWPTILWYREQVRRSSPDLIHLHTPNTEMVHAAASLCIGERFAGRLFRTVHSIKRPTAALPRLAYAMNREATSIAVSQAAAETHRSMIDAPLFTVSNGVSFTQPVRDQELSWNAKRGLGLDPNVQHCLHLGRMGGDSLASAPKAHDVLIQAWRRSEKGLDGHTLHLLGDGPLRHELERLAEDDPSIVFHGIRSDVAQWLLAADGLLFPSRIEGLPLAAIEGIGAGLPCVLSDIGPLRELEPPAATYVPVDDVGALAQAIREFRPVLVNAEQTLAFRTRFSIQTAADGYIARYQQRNESRSLPAQALVA